MWSEISNCWKIAFEEAWIAFGNGCVPIGGALFDSDGTLLLRDHNRNAEKDTLNRRIAHAEANVLRRLDTDHTPALQTLVLYTTMEPCPMCMGTSVMSNIRHLRYAARDPWCGFTYLANQEPYLIGKRLDYTLEGGQLEFVQITIQSLFELTRIQLYGSSDVVLVQFRSMLPDAVALAEAIFAKGLHLRWLEEARPMSEVFDEILTLAQV